MLESALERRVRGLIKALGGKAYKWESPGCVGVPDRIVVLPTGKVVFVELKRPGMENGLSERQKKEHKRLRTLGATVWTICDMEDLRTKLRGLGYEV